MSKFKCKDKTCQQLDKDEMDDSRLILNIEEGVRYQYYVNEDGSLEHYDNDGLGQEVYLQCNICGQKYEFDMEISHLFEQHVLPFKKRDIKDLRVRKKS